MSRKPRNRSEHEADAYEERGLGVSASKPDVRRALEGLNQGLFPGAFCKAVPDIIGGSPDHCVVMHADGVGTKSAIAYIHYRRHGDAKIFRSLAQDSLVMNLDDLLCVGCTGPFVFSNTIGRNAKRIPGEVVSEIIRGYEEFAERLRPFGVELVSCGGETADLGDLVRTVVIDSSMTAQMRREDFIDCSRVSPGHAIVGLASFGRASYETDWNSGIGTNGFAALRHALFKSEYREEFPETHAPEIGKAAYRGKHDIDDILPGTSCSLGEACLSPTRTYAPVILPIIRDYRRHISAIFHNTGGGQTKCLNFGKDVKYVKDDLFPPSPIFEFLRSETDLTVREMAQIFNIGHRMEIVCDPKIVKDIAAIAANFSVEAKLVGHVERSPGRTLRIHASDQCYEFQAASA
jgi:phosphoribosylformylglycinamidine cyclo-ligase